MLTVFAVVYLLLEVVRESSCTPQGPRFVQEPPRPRVSFSNSTGAVLPCVAHGQVRWLISGGAPAQDIPGLRHVRPDGSLVFPPFRAEEYRPDVHDAVYRCSATNEIGTVLSREVKVRGVVDQSYSVDVYDEFVLVGNTAVLRCRVPPQVQDFVTITSWIRDGSLVIRPTALAGDRFSIFNSGELHIRRVDHSDALRLYRCEARHRLTGEKVLSATAGRILVTDTLRESLPRITSSQRIIRATEGGTLEAPCAAQGNPPPQYHWFRKDRDGLSPLQGPFGTRLLQLEGTLLIREVHPSDSGHYLCKATNVKGEVSAETEILVTAPLSADVVPRSQSVDVGRPAIFNCSVSGYPVTKIEWSKDGRTLKPGQHRNSFPDMDVLRIAAVRPQDAGMYQCLASNDQDSVQGSAQLTLGDYPPTLLEKFPERTLNPGDALSMRCVAQGRPLPQVTWSLDGSPVPESASRLRMGDYVRSGGHVVSYVNVSAVRPEDGGYYSCVAENGAGCVMHAAHIRVSGPPVVRPMKNGTAVAGETMRQACPVGGHPIESIRWEKDGSRLPFDHRQKVHPNGTLQIRNVEKDLDDGLYTCIATGSDGITAQNSLFVTVLVRPEIDPFAFPKSLRQGQRYSVLCIVTQGDPPVRITWTKEGSPGPPQNDPDIRVLAVTAFSSSLVFDSVSPEQRGNYTCSAENRAGRASHSSSMVIHVPPRWRIEPGDISATRGRPAVVDCQADGFPVPRIRWTKAEGDQSDEFRPISSSSRLHVFENGSLVVHSVQPEDAGQYLCQANNGVGQGLSKVVHLSVHVSAHFESKFRAESVRKGQDVRLVCDAVGDRPIHISWLKDKQPLDLQSDLRYDMTETVLGEGTTSSLTIRRVDRRDSALYTCLAMNTYGQDDTNIQLIAQEAPDAPQDAKVLEFGSRSAKIGWTAPYSGNSPIIQYILLYHEQEGKGQQLIRNATFPGSQTSGVARGLLPATSYNFQVCAENSLGRSEPGSVIHLKTEEEAPGGAPQKVKARSTGAHTLKVTWRPPRQDLQYGAVHGYYVGYRESGSKEAFVYKTLPAKGEASKSEEAELSGLKRLTEYEVTVQAYNAKGASPPSDQVLAKTLENDPPGSPTVRVVFANHTTIKLTWEQTDIENSVEGYIVHHQGELGDWKETELSSGEEEIVFHDLKCGSRYNFYVSAFNPVGRGLPSDVIRTKTDGRAPIAPDKQSFLSTNQTCASIHLEAWLDGGCPISDFSVRYRQQRHQQWMSATISDTVLILEDLAPATWYRIQVTAHNEAGSTDAEYTFATSPLHYEAEDDTTSPPDDFFLLWLDSQVLVPAAVSLVVVGALVVLICVVAHKKPPPHHISQSGIGNEHYGSTRKCHSESVPLSQKSSLKKTLSDPHSSYYPSPYATTRISAEEQQKETADRQALEEPPYATVKRTPRPPRPDFHVYHYPGEMPEFFLQRDKDVDDAGEESSSSVFWKEIPDPELKGEDFRRSREMQESCERNSGGQRLSHRYSQR